MTLPRRIYPADFDDLWEAVRKGVMDPYDGAKHPDRPEPGDEIHPIAFNCKRCNTKCEEEAR